VGFGGVRRITWQGQVVLNLYYKLQPAIWRHGYATELARAAIGLAQTHLPHLPIIARTRPDNLASQRTAERAGLLRRPDLDTAEYVTFALRWQAPTLE
jgi:RimJ/RimL family protein N-acetyltransferase